MTITNLIATVKALDPAQDTSPHGAFEAVISMPTVDRDGEVVDAGAFDPLPTSIPILADHEGRVRSLVARAVPNYDGTTLKAVGYFGSHEFAQYVRQLVTEGLLDTMSVGFMPPSRKMVGGVPHIVKSELLEASFVVIPSNREALVTSAKAMEGASDGKQYADVEPVEGSYEDTQEDLRESLRAMYPESYISILATFDDHVIFTVESYPMQDTDGTYSADYSSQEGIDELTIEPPTAVEVSQVVSAVTLSRMASVTKTGRRNAAKDQENLNAAHEAIVAAGAQCDPPEKTSSGSEIKSADLDLVGLEADMLSIELDDELI